MWKTSIILSCASEDFEYLRASVESIRRFTERGTYQLIIVEHGGSTSARDWLIEQTDVITLFHDELLSQAQAWNTGLNVATGDSVLFLHSDTLVTENWLTYMIQSLYQDDRVAGVGPLTNYAEGTQGTEIQFSSIEDLLYFAKKNGCSFRQEQRLTLADFCLLFKKEAIEQIGNFNEKLSGQVLGIDYSLRAIKAGFKLILTKHVFIHHYGEKDNNEADSNEFKQIWGFDASLTQQKTLLQSSIQAEFDKTFRVLQIGSGCGATLLNLKQNYPNASVFGVESNRSVMEISKELQLITKESLEAYVEEEESFDYIILNAIDDLENTLYGCYTLLKDGGKLIANFANIHHYSTIISLLKGKALPSGFLTNWTINTLPALFEQVGFDEFKIDYRKKEMEQPTVRLMNELKKLVDHELPTYFNAEQFLITASKEIGYKVLHELFNQLFQTLSDEVLEEILQYSTGKIIKATKEYKGPVVSLLNYLAITNYERNRLDQIFPLLNTAYEMNPDDPTTLFNLGTVHYGLGKDKDALNWLLKLPEKTEQVENWIYELEEIVSLKHDSIKWLTFLLLRIEQNVQREESLTELTMLIETQKINANQILNVIIENIIDKTNTINILINHMYERNHYELVLDLLKLSLNYQENRDDTLFLIANMLFKLEHYPDALEYLSKIVNRTERVSRLIKNIKIKSFNSVWM